jgi:hypothetical protein
MSRHIWGHIGDCCPIRQRQGVEALHREFDDQLITPRARSIDFQDKLSVPVNPSIILPVSLKPTISGDKH